MSMMISKGADRREGAAVLGLGWHLYWHLTERHNGTHRDTTRHKKWPLSWTIRHNQTHRRTSESRMAWKRSGVQFPSAPRISPGQMAWAFVVLGLVSVAVCYVIGGDGPVDTPAPGWLFRRVLVCPGREVVVAGMSH